MLVLMRVLKTRASVAPFVFQAGDGMRAELVTGVQTCAPPIALAAAVIVIALSSLVDALAALAVTWSVSDTNTVTVAVEVSPCWSRSEERRVGKEGRSRWSPYHYKKQTGL